LETLRLSKDDFDRVNEWVLRSATSPYSDPNLQQDEPSPMQYQQNSFPQTAEARQVEFIHENFPESLEEFAAPLNAGEKKEERDLNPPPPQAYTGSPPTSRLTIFIPIPHYCKDGLTWNRQTAKLARRKSGLWQAHHRRTSHLIIYNLGSRERAS